MIVIVYYPVETVRIVLSTRSQQYLLMRLAMFANHDLNVLDFA